MTIPPFDDQGNLPPGIHFCTWDEFIARFDTTAKRSRQIEGLKNLNIEENFFHLSC